MRHGLTHGTRALCATGNLGGEAETAAIWAAVRVIRAGCRGLLRQLMELAQQAGVLCEEDADALPQDEAAHGEAHPPQLHACELQPAGGAAAALAAAVEASLHCPLWGADEEDDQVALASAARPQEVATFWPAVLRATDQVMPASAPRVRCPVPRACTLRLRPRLTAASAAPLPQAAPGRRPVWTEGGVLFTLRYVRPRATGRAASSSASSASASRARLLGVDDAPQSGSALLRVPVRYTPRDAFEQHVRALAAWRTRA
jgi:hypothetical protein